MLRIAVVSVSMAVLGACSTAPLQSQPSETIAVSADRLSACVYYKLLSNVHVSHVMSMNEGNTVHLTGGIDGSGYYRYSWDVAFVPIDAQMTRVEVRSRNNVWTGDVAPSDVAISIRDCRLG